MDSTQAALMAVLSVLMMAEQMVGPSAEYWVWMSVAKKVEQSVDLLVAKTVVGWAESSADELADMLAAWWE